jgi:hypothetical protein
MTKRRKKGYKSIQGKSSSNFEVKKIMIYFFALLLLIGIYLYLSSFNKTAEQTDNESLREEPRFRKDGELRFLDPNGSLITTIELEIAADLSSRTQGLMYRQSMEENRGMLFIFPQSHNIEMWMRNTYIPLDMIFVREDRSIAHIATHTTPFSEETIRSPEPVLYVIEVNAGFTEKHGVRTGQIVVWD